MSRIAKKKKASGWQPTRIYRCAEDMNLMATHLLLVVVVAQTEAPQRGNLQRGGILQRDPCSPPYPLPTLVRVPVDL